MTMCGPEIFGADPVRIKWNVVRGDTASIRVEFLDDDEVTYFDISNWTFSASSYDPKGDIIDELTVTPGNGYVDIVAGPDLTQFWGTGYGSQLAELSFDLEVTVDDLVWTPVIGNILVIGDVSGSL
jgi:hypothetical protein